MVAGWLEPTCGMCTSRMVSVRLLPRSPPVDSSACCCGLRSSRLSDPTSNQLVPLAAGGRSVYSLNTVIRRRDESIQIVVVSIATTMTSPKVKVLNIIRLPQRVLLLAVARLRLGGCGGSVDFLTAG